MLPDTEPSLGRSLPASSTIFISQPNTGRPCLAVMAKRSASGSWRSPLLKRVRVPSGLISVLPPPGAHRDAWLLPKASDKGERNARAADQGALDRRHSKLVLGAVREQRQPHG